jgi:hypothetical protein
MTPADQSFQLPWAFFFPPLQVVRDLRAYSNAEQLSIGWYQYWGATESPGENIDGPSSNQAGLISMICLMYDLEVMTNS